MVRQVAGDETSGDESFLAQITFFRISIDRSMETIDRAALLTALRKCFAAFLKAKGGKSTNNQQDSAELLVLFAKVMNHFTPDELCTQFKEFLSFTANISEELVQEIRRRASSENTREAAQAVYRFIRAEPADSRGWMLLQTIIFISNSGSPKVFECLCKALLPNTLVKVSYLFMDLPSDAESAQEQATRRRLYDSLVMLIMSLCSQPLVAEELAQRDDLFLLFVGASSRSPLTENIWRNANFTFLCSLVGKALTPPVLKYLQTKRCIAHYLASIGGLSTPEEEDECTVLLCNLLDLLRSSADSTGALVDDFETAHGFQFTLEHCVRGTARSAEHILAALTSLVTAGERTVHFNTPQQSAATIHHFHSQPMVRTAARNAATVRQLGAYKVLELCFAEGSDALCLLSLEKIGQLFRAERMNYFIVDEASSLFLVTEAMLAKGVPVQEKVLELVEGVLRSLNHVPYKEISSLNLHLKNSVQARDFGTAERLLHFFFKIISINATLRDAFRELLILETFLHVVQQFSGDPNCFAQGHIRRMVQLCMDLLISATKGNVLNAQFITENMDVKIVKTLLLADCAGSAELRSSIEILIKQLLYLAKNEQLFSSMLQLLFSESENTELCTVILKLFNAALLESHKVRIMFRRSGGFICLMTLLLHVEHSLEAPSDPDQQHSLGWVERRDRTLRYIALLLQVLTVGMRYEPSNAKYFQSEVRPSILNPIIRNLGCFSLCANKVDAHSTVWEHITLENCAKRLAAIHECFRIGTGLYNAECNRRQNGADSLPEMPPNLFNALLILRLLLDLAFDNFEKSSNELHWAGLEWLQNAENLETVPVLTWSNATVLAHPTAVLSIVQLLPSVAATPTVGESALDEWSAAAQLYIALVLKSVLRSERNQQTMCQFDMPAILLEVGEELFKIERHPLLSSFHYFFERLAYQSLHSAELRHFLRLDKPLCCTNLDDSEDDGDGESEKAVARVKAGGPIPIHRIKAFVSMLTPRNHSFVHSPAFVEFDLAIEGFASLVIPSLSAGTRPNGHHSGSSSPSSASPSSDASTFSPSAGFTLAMWFNITELANVEPKSSPQPTTSICLFSIVRSYDTKEAENAHSPSSYGHQLAANIENHQTSFQVHIQRTECCWTLVVSSMEHSVADELRKDFRRAPEQCIQVPLSEQYFPPKQWAHMAIVISKSSSPLLKSNSGGGAHSNVEVFINGRSLASQKLAFAWSGSGTQQSLDAGAAGGAPNMHAFVGTLPFFRRPSHLKWRLASVYLIEEALQAETLRKIVALGVAYVGNLQTSADGQCALVAEEKILLALNAASTTEINAQALRPLMSSRTDVELIASLVGISPNDTSTPLRVLCNMAISNGPNSRSVPPGAVLIGYLGVRTFFPCPVSALLDSIGGLSPLFGLVAMSSDSSGLYASLKVLVSAVHTNRSIHAEMHRKRGFQTLAILLEEKAALMNSHILHLVLTLAGTVDDGQREQVGIPNLQTFEDLLCDLDVWREAPLDVWKLLLEHFFELLIETSTTDNLNTIRASPLLTRLLIQLSENRTLFPVRNDVCFRLIGAIVQPPCDAHSLLRLGQSISATIAFDIDETGYPFHIAELEKLLLEGTNGKKTEEMSTLEEGGGEILDLQLYAVYVRNRLLNILCTMLSHSNAQMNNQLCTSIVKTLGFGWILAFCGPRVHHGTLFLAMRILVNLLRYPALVEKFRDGSANGGWLSDADSVIRNRAAVLLGFSVANQVGAVGAHVDINPELDKCSGFASLEHVAYAHADKPFVYLALLSVLFQQQHANVQPLADFTIECIWSHVFALGEQHSVAEAIERAQFCADTVVSLVATIRAALHKQMELGVSTTDADIWAQNYPLRLLQLFTFLYQNSAQFFAICHTEAFVVVLFSSLLPPTISPQTPSSAASGGTRQVPFFAEMSNSTGNENNDNEAISSGGAAMNRCSRQCLELLTNILLNDLCLSNETRAEPLFDAIIEFLDCNGPQTHNKQSALFTELVNACLDHFMASKMFFATTPNAAPLIVPPSARNRLNQSSEQTSANVVRFLSRMIDTVWNCMYKGNPIRILKCFLKLLAEAHASNKAAAQLQCTDAHIASLFRLILFLLSRPIDNVNTQMCVLDTLAEIVRNQHLFLTPKTSVEPLFYAALVHLVFMLSDRQQFDLQDARNRQLERGTAQVSICAQSVWGILWQYKKAVLEEWLRKGDIDLDLFTARAKCGAEANRAWLQFVDSQTDGSYSLHHQHQDGSSSNRLLAAQKMLPAQLQTKLSRVAARGFQRLRKSTTLMDGASGTSSTDSQHQRLGSLHRFDDERLRVEPETFYMWIRVHISLLRELIRSQCQRYHEWHAHVRKWCLQEWHSAETELTRERGLWGPSRGSVLEKFQLDVTEGPCRIRRKLVPNTQFYHMYAYRPNLDVPEAKSLRAKVAISKDAKAFYERMRAKRAETMDERIVDFHAGLLPSPGSGVAPAEQQNGAQQTVDASAELNMSMIKRMVQKNLELTEQQKAAEKLEAVEDKKCIEEEVDEEEEEDFEDLDEDKLNGPKLASVDEEEDKQLQSTDAMEEKSSSDKGKSATATQIVLNVDKNGTGVGGSKLQQLRKKRDASVSETVGQGPDNQTLLRLLEQGEQLHSMFRCARVLGLDTMEGLLLFGRDHFYVVDGFTLLKTREIRDLDFLPDQFHDPIIPYIAMGCRSRPQSTKTNRQCNKFAYDDIKEVHKRRYLLQQIALEVFSADGRNFLLAFPRKVRDRVYQKIVSMAKNASSDVAQFMQEQKKLRPTESGSMMGSSMVGSMLISQLLSGQQQHSITHKWQRGEISNFHYVMYLNTLAGRSYNDLSQYPTFPWILADYDSEQLDLTIAATFRDLAKPMGAQSAERLGQFLKRFREWDDPGGTPPYMYGTHYSSAMIVLSYLVRLEPFTQQFLKLQGGHFDLADRMFHSIGDAYWSAARNNMADVKELIPEFFYLPEMFLNANAFDLGVKQNGTQLNNVQLPVWAHGDPHEFVRLHRQALECDYVSEHLHEWIDLIFGHKQTGEAAREANNVFHHLFYETSVDIETIEDPLTRNATLGFINNFGQIPSQLFKKPHPQRKVSSQQQPLVQVVPGVSTAKLFYHVPEQLRAGTRPVKELRAAVGDIIVNDKGNQVVVLEQNKVLLPPSNFLAWGFYDRSLRFGSVGHEKSVCILETSDVYEITCMASTDGRQVFAGLSTGTVFVWTLSSSSGASSAGNSRSAPTGARLSPKKALDGHSDAVTALAASAAHNVLVSGSRDRTAILWHLTQLSFIRQLAGPHPGAITAVAVNEAKGDIATSSGAWLFLWTVNGVPLAVVNTVDSGLFSNASSLILCISFSTVNDWDENNVLMCGTSDGLVKMYSCERAKHQQTSPVNTTASEEAQAKSGGSAADAVKEHLLRRQQRIQQHHHNALHQRQTSAASTVQRSLDAVSLESQSSTPSHCSSAAAASFSRQSSSAQTGQQPQQIMAPPPGMEGIKWRRSLRLRRILSEHTAFTHGNPQPAPVTAVRPTKDHRSVLVGDGVGRIWMWSIAPEAPPSEH